MNAENINAQSADTGVVDTGLVTLVLVAQIHGIAAEIEQLRHQFVVDGAKLDSMGLVLAAQSLQMKARIIRYKGSLREALPYPLIAKMKNGDYVLVGKWKTDGIILHDATAGETFLVPHNVFAEQFDNELIFLASRASRVGNLARFDFSWFVPAIVKYRKHLLETLVISIVLQVIALATPLFFQVVTDKVLVNKTASTLQVLAIGLMTAYIFENLLTALRTYIFAHTTNRIDVELGARLFHHLLHLPISYFQARRVGDSVARVHELESIRSFITGHAITVVLDLCFSVIFIVVMFFYSVKLTVVVLVSIPIYVIVSFIFTPILRARLQTQFDTSAENQAFLVESVSGVETLKASAVEPQWQRNWDKLLAAYVHASFRAMTTGLLASTAIQLTSRITSVAIMWLGSLEVIAGNMTIGELIAFNMFAQHVAEPVVRLAGLWNEFQQVGIAMERLGDILNSPMEGNSSKVVLPRLIGKINVVDTYFRYNPDSQDVLRGVNVEIKPGEVIGIVGKSGSGKSTLTKLVQRLQSPRQGRILIDDIDLSTVDAASLRRQIGVVLQENVLFSRSIGANIALSDPATPMTKIVEAAKLAGAHEFISELPSGYDTLVGEHGSTLSGGQRQRVAIARALLADPRILIFDEATSALDYESERAIHENMERICANKTVLIIAHRLSSVRGADRIIVFDRGQIVEEGRYHELATKENGYFARLLELQSQQG